MVKHIPLTQGKVALVDDEDLAIVSGHSWRAMRHGKTYYAYTNVRAPCGHRELLAMHQLIMGHDDEGRTPDHKDLNGLNNRRNNLRFAAASQQAMNRNVSSRSVSGLKGVSRSGERWRARIRVGGRLIGLGTFDCAEDAAAAYDTKVRDLYGQFARTNF